MDAEKSVSPQSSYSLIGSQSSPIVIDARRQSAFDALYKVVAGVRRQIAGQNIAVANGVWHTLSLKILGDTIEVTFNGQPILEAKDGTFTEPGKVGLWPKADSLTHFVDLVIHSCPRND
jgi:hypothetical protein